MPATPKQMVKMIKGKMRKQVVDVGKLKWYTAQPFGWSNHPFKNEKNHHHILDGFIGFCASLVIYEGYDLKYGMYRTEDEMSSAA